MANITPEESHELWASGRFRKIVGRLTADAMRLSNSPDPATYDVPISLIWSAAKEIFDLQNKVSELEAELAKLKGKGPNGD